MFIHPTHTLLRTALLGAVLLARPRFAHAHTTVWGLWVNGADQGDGRNVYIRSPPNNSPVVDLTSDAMACNVDNRSECSRVCAR